jgi:ABC-type lipoprotein release transport system permease subunit
MPILLTYILRSAWRRRWSTGATAAGIGLVVFVLSGSLMLARGVRSALMSAGRDDRAIVLQADAETENGSRFPQSALGIVSSLPGVRHAPDGHALVSGETLVQLTLARVDVPERIVSVQIRGVTERVFEVRPEVRIVSGRALRPGTGEAIVGAQLVGRYAGVQLGGDLEIGKGRTVRIVGIFEAAASVFESEIWANLDSVQTAMEGVGDLSAITLVLERPAAFSAFSKALTEEYKQEGLKPEIETAYYRRLSEGFSGLIAGLGSMLTLIFSIGAIMGAAITMYAAVAQRTREIGVLLALGFTQRQILAAFLLESCSVSVAGSALGTLLASLASLLEFSTVNVGTGGGEVVFTFIPSATLLAGVALTGVVVGVSGGLLPAIKASRTNPLKAIRA